jgi:hypothetical protein
MTAARHAGPSILEPSYGIADLTIDFARDWQKKVLWRKRHKAAERWYKQHRASYRAYWRDLVEVLSCLVFQPDLLTLTRDSKSFWKRSALRHRDLLP